MYITTSPIFLAFAYTYINYAKGGAILKEQNLITSTLILTCTSFFTRIIGMISVIFLSHILGSDGLGLYHLISSLYTTAVVFASAGLSASVSKLIAEELGHMHITNVGRIMRMAFAFSLVTSCCISILLFVSAPMLSNYLIQDNRSILCLRIFSFSLPFIACSSCFKGYFYAARKTVFPASADILEQTVKVFLLVLLVKLYAPYGDYKTYAVIALGLTIGEMTSWSYLGSLYLIERRRHPVTMADLMDFSSKQSLFIRFLKILVPIAVISYLACIFMSVENVLIPKGLKTFNGSSGYSMSMYGMLKGMVMPILFFPSAFLTSFSTTLIPEIAKANVLKHINRVRYTTNRVIQFTCILSFLVVGIFLTYSDELGIVIYHNEEIGSMLRILSIIVPFMYIEVVSDGILKGLGRQVSCLKYSIFDSIFRTTAIYFLLPIKGIYAFISIMIISNILTSTLNFSKLLESTTIELQLNDWIFKPALCAMAGGTFSRFIINAFFKFSLTLTYKLILAIGINIGIYIFLLFLTSCFSLDDINWIKRHLGLNTANTF